MSFDNLKLVKSSKLPYEMDVHELQSKKMEKYSTTFITLTVTSASRMALARSIYIKNVLDWDNSVKTVELGTCMVPRS